MSSSVVPSADATVPTGTPSPSTTNPPTSSSVGVSQPTTAPTPPIANPVASTDAPIAATAPSTNNALSVQKADVEAKSEDDDGADEGTSPAWFQRTCADLSHAISTPPKHSDAAMAVYTKASNMWDVGSVITYSYLSGTSKQQSKVDNTIVEWQYYANIIFRKVASQGQLRITFNANDGSWSYIGKQNLQVASTKATLNLGWIKDDNNLTADQKGTILHEFGHALGLMHELQSPSRPGALRLDEDAVYKFYEDTQGWDHDLVKTQIIDVYKAGDISNYSQFDSTSIMEYYMPAEMNLERKEIPPNNALSNLDKAYTVLNYPLPSPDSHAAQWTIAHALDVAGVTGSDRDNILNAGSVDDIRVQFNAWNAYQRSHPSRDVDPETPPRDADPEPPLQAPRQPDSAMPLQSGSFLQAIVDSLKQFFNPGGGQIFTLQFPGRFLQISQYAWDTSSAGIYGQFIKPVAVNESEFRLVDQLYDVAEVVGGPNGISLSQVYDQLLNNLLPIFRSNGLAKQQDQIRQWLLREVKTATWIQELIEAQHSSGNTSTTGTTLKPIASSSAGEQPSFAIANKLSAANTVNRIELSNALMQEYLQAKQAWEVERDGMIQQALQLKLGTEESEAALNTLTRTLAHTTAVREAQLASKYADAVVRGYTHNVREYVGYLDVKSSAEGLQDAKDSLREAAMSSLDGSLQVYPVQMNPIDWFEGLNTSFTLEDLTSDPELIAQQINAKSNQLDMLNSQLVALQFGTKGNVKTAEDQVAAAQADLDSAQAALASQYTNNIISMAKTCIDKYGQLDKDKLNDVGAKLGLASSAITQLGDSLKDTMDAQTKLTSASRVFSQALAGLALAQATDTQQQQQQIRLNIDSITKELNELTTRYQSLSNVTKAPPPTTLPSVADIPLLPENNNDTSGGSRWQEITMHHQVTSIYSGASDQSSARSSASACNLWFFSSSTSSSSSSGTSESVALKATNEIWVGFRATLVTVDRAGWFQPQFFKQSSSYYHISPGPSWSKWPASIKTMDALKTALSSTATDATAAQLNQYLLPAFPIGFIICKDITIKILNDSSSDSTYKENMQSSSAASGGVLCFSYSSSNSASESQNSHNFTSCSDGCVIRIPGPQILGYIMQLTENDTTEDMPNELPTDFFIPDADYDAVTGDDGKPQDDVKPTDPPAVGALLMDQISSVLKGANLPASTLDSVNQAIQKELEAVSKDVADRVLKG